VRLIFILTLSFASSLYAQTGSPQHGNGMFGGNPYGMGMGGMGMMGMGGMGMMGMGGMGMMGGMGGGGGGSSSVESKFKPETLEQPAKEAREKIAKVTESTIAANQKAAEAVGEFFKSMKPEEAKLDEATIKSLSYVNSGESSKAIAASTTEFMSQIQVSGEIQSKLVAKTAETLSAAKKANEEMASQARVASGSGIAERIASIAANSASSPSRAPASAAGAAMAQTATDAASSARGFAKGLLHNPPTGLELK
jgi:hypothetical protein